MAKILKFKDKRRKHHHFLVVITYTSSDHFGRVYTSLERAQRFADRQKKSPTVKSVQVRKLS